MLFAAELAGEFKDRGAEAEIPFEVRSAIIAVALMPS
jgi:hypothetical protein